MPITMEEIRKSQMRQAAHFIGEGFFGYRFHNIQFPRLSRVDKYVKKDRSVTSTWQVDGTAVESLEKAVEALNIPPILTLEEHAALKIIPDEFENLRAVEARMGGNPHLMIHQLNAKGQVEYGRDPNRSDGEPWADSVPEHLRFSPTIRRRPQ